MPYSSVLVNDAAWALLALAGVILLGCLWVASGSATGRYDEHAPFSRWGWPWHRRRP